MLARILGKIGLPILIRFMSSALGRINHQSAQKAVLVLNDLHTVIRREEIPYDELRSASRWPEKSGELENAFSAQTLSHLRENLHQEFKAEGRFSKLWRPAFGYSVALSWFLCISTICYVVVSDNPRSPEIIMALVETTSLWGIALGVLGISVVKTNTEIPIPKSRPIFNKNQIQPTFIKEKNYGRSTFPGQAESAGNCNGQQ